MYDNYDEQISQLTPRKIDDHDNEMISPIQQYDESYKNLIKKRNEYNQQEKQQIIDELRRKFGNDVDVPAVYDKKGKLIYYSGSTTDIRNLRKIYNELLGGLKPAAE
jgi:hypothetical protein